MIPQRLLNYVSDMNAWYADGRREPQKPLLLLLALARVQAGKPRLMAFDEIEEKLQQVIEDFGLNTSASPRIPFLALTLRKNLGNSAKLHRPHHKIRQCQQKAPPRP